MEEIIGFTYDIIWSIALIVLCAFAGIYFSIRTRFMQFRYIKSMLLVLFSKDGSKKGISPFQAFSLAISGRVGTGNIVGVSTAISMGGPGAIFWMWIIALLGSASAFVEATLGQLYKKSIHGQYRGGPAFYIEKGLNMKVYAIFFALVTIISCGVLLPGVQSNSISMAMTNAFNFSDFNLFGFSFNYAGIGLMAILSLIIFGGVKRLGKVSEIIIPLMAAIYLIMVIVILGVNFKQIPEIFRLIYSSAFSMDSTFGGIVGAAISWGIKRGIYSNEAGQGTAPHAAAAAEVTHPAQQGIVQAFSVYIDTLVICTSTALMILVTNSYNVTNEDTNQVIVEHLPNANFSNFTQEAVSTQFPTIGNEFIAIALFFFAFTTIMAYYYYAETNLTYILRKESKWMISILQVVFLLAVYQGTTGEATMAWKIGDIGVGLMAWTNIIAILLLGNIAMKVWKDYEKKKKAGEKSPEFNPLEIGIKNADFWEKRWENRENK